MTSNTSVNLILKTSDLTINSSDQYGTCNEKRTAFTWNNINLRTLLGDNFDKYDRFNLYAINIFHSVPVGSIGVSSEDRVVMVKMSGIPFINGNYNCKTGTNNGGVYAIPILFSATAAFRYQYGHKIGTFIKQNDLINISIEYVRVSDDTPVNTTINFPNTVFQLAVEGVDDYKIEPTEHKMILKK